MGGGERPLPQPFTLEQRLLEAVRQGDRATIEKALERGASIDSRDDLQRSTVLLAVLDAKDLELVRWLHAHGGAIDTPDAGGRTPLSYAAADGALATVRYLLDEGAAVDQADRQKRTPLFHAALGDHTGVVALLIDRGAAVDPRDRYGDTPLIVACAKGNAATAALLIERGADRNARDQEGRSAAERAAPGTGPCRLSATPAT